jgi:hypothetical protein
MGNVQNCDGFVTEVVFNKNCIQARFLFAKVKDLFIKYFNKESKRNSNKRNLLT